MLKLFKKSRRDDGRLDMDAILGDFELPSFPVATLRILDAIRNPEADSESIATLVQANPTAMVKLLQLVNSAAFGTSTTVTSVAHAIRLLGRARLESLLLGLAVKDALPNQSIGSFDPHRFWRGSFRRATLAKRLAEELIPSKASECFTIGLLEDMAVPVLATARSAEYSPLLEAWNAPENGVEDLEGLERDSFGFTHAEVGEEMGRRWEMPTPLINAITGHHHGPSDDVHAPIYLTSLLREGDSAPERELIVEEARSHYGIDPDGLLSAMDEAFHDAEELATSLA